MAFFESLHEIAKALLLNRCGPSPDRFLLDRAIAFTRADRGFIVVRERGSFQEKYQVHFDRGKISPHKRKFSRTLVKKAIASQEVLLVEDPAEDPVLSRQESVINMGSSSVLVAPLAAEGEVYAVIYMEKQGGGSSFDARAPAFMAEFSLLAAAAFQHALERERLARLQEIFSRDRRDGFDDGGIIGRHPKMVALLEMVAQVAPSNATVLISGETGSGKEKIAEAIYLNSERLQRPFVTVHCGALPETLFEAELFGHTRGAFSGADRERPGRIARASGGTLFIDEVAEIPLVSQAKLLRFLQSGEFQRLGSDQVEKIDVRIVAATHRDLKQMVAQGDFREDLYYRLNVIELSLPPLRERKSDILLLTRFFLEKFWKDGLEPPRLSAMATSVLERYDFPGNVRELAHLVERMCTLARGPLLDVDLLPDSLKPASSEPEGLTSQTALDFGSYSNEALKAARQAAGKEAMRKVEVQYLNGLMERYQGNISKAAAGAGMQRSYLHRLLARSRDHGKGSGQE